MHRKAGLLGPGGHSPQSTWPLSCRGAGTVPKISGRSTGIAARVSTVGTDVATAQREAGSAAAAGRIRTIASPSPRQKEADLFVISVTSKCILLNSLTKFTRPSQAIG